ncbi:hypothetical protein VUR80DRAFT_4616 [Thermomyces stellatus]
MPSYVDTRPLDVIIIGAGFGGCYLLRNLRKQGFRAVIFEEGHGLGGVWWHNRYPGARVDTNTPFYEFSDPDLWNEWEWPEEYPSRDDMLRYFEFVDEKWDLSRDITFGATVSEATFDEKTNRWTIRTHQGHVASAPFLLLAIGFAAKAYIPQLEGLDTFQGRAFHSAMWPEDLSISHLHGKNIGIVGSGATGVQLVQELGPIAGNLVAFQRSPNCALPMRQRSWGPGQRQDKTNYAQLFRDMKKSKSGFTYPVVSKRAKDDTPEQQKAFFEHLWQQGGFAPAQGNYSDFMTDLESNHLFYRFWRDKVRQRLTRNDPELIESLAPEHPPYPFSTKRPSLEQNYYEVFNQTNVKLANLKKNPIERIVPEGVKMADGTVHKLDYLLLATGFDAVTGGFSRINIRGLKGKNLSHEWRAGSRTFLGMSVSGFPNMFFLYGPQSPTAWAIGPIISEIQGDWIIKTLVHMRANGYARIDPERYAEKDWARRTNEACSKTLLSQNETTWYMGSNVPGKPREALNYVAGLPSYQQALDECSSDGWTGFHIQ